MTLRSILSTPSKIALPRPQSHVCPRSHRLSAVPRLSTTLPSVHSLTSIHLFYHYCCGALPPFSSYHPLPWTIVPFLQTSLHNEVAGDGRRRWRRRDPAVVTRRSSRQIGEIRQLGWFAPNWEDAIINVVRVAERC
jgi:hypothetical protein